MSALRAKAKIEQAKNLAKADLRTTLSLRPFQRRYGARDRFG
jgi:hypothetical protein